MAGKTTIVLITGGNTGIGLETVKALLRSERSYHILLGGRNLNKAQEAARLASTEITSKSTVQGFQVDVEDDESISKAFDEISLQQSRIDCLVNNAGASYDPYITDGRMSIREAWNKTWSVNVTGAHIMTLTFLPLLLKSEDPRLLFITSGLSSLDIAADANHSSYIVPPAGLPKQWGQPGYKSSKAGLNMAMLEWTKMLKNDGVKVWSIAPGRLATGLGGRTDIDAAKQAGAGDASVGGRVLCNVVEGKRDADAGRVVREYDSPIQPW